MAFLSFICGSSSDVRVPGRREASGWRSFSLKELHSATNSFNYDNKLGEGGFGSVYWGQLWDGSQIAVKRLKVWSNKAELEFSAEVEILARVRHKNLLSLRGYCAEGHERLIVYDYMPNLSLMSHLHGDLAPDRLLHWNRRMNIAVGSAEAIAYLHHHSTPHIIHRDIKASNVLLDSEFQARVSDFGFAKLIPEGATHVTTRVKGTLGYLAPEYALFGKASESCDVYSMGVLLLELACGRRPLEKLSPTVRRSISEWALPLARERRFGEMADPKLDGKFVEEELKRMVLVALVCARGTPEKRPTMAEVVELLKGDGDGGGEKLAAALEKDGFFRPDRFENSSSKVPPLLRYGKYCGIMYSGCPGEKPCDGLDYCCMVHDACIQARDNDYLSQKCNQDLLDCITRFREKDTASFKGNKCMVQEVADVITVVIEAALLAGKVLHKP